MPENSLPRAREQLSELHLLPALVQGFGEPHSEKHSPSLFCLLVSFLPLLLLKAAHKEALIAGGSDEKGFSGVSSILRNRGSPRFTGMTCYTFVIFAPQLVLLS